MSSSERAPQVSATTEVPTSTATSRLGTMKSALRSLLTAVAILGLAYDTDAHFDLAANRQ